jgi:hypothetical protein
MCSRHVRSFNALIGEWARGSRAQDGLEPHGDSPEGASIPRARRSFARGGVQPSSEVEFHPRGAFIPRARRSFARGGVQPSSEVEFWWYGAGPLERGGDLPEGCRGRPLDGPLRLPGQWALLTAQNRAQVHRKPMGDLVPFHQGGSSLDLSIQGSEANH